MSSSFICEKCGSTSFEQMTYTQARCLQCGYLNLHDSGFKGQREFQLSPDKDLLNVEEKTTYETAPMIKRFVNYIVDVFAIVIIIMVIGNLADLDRKYNQTELLNIYRIAAFIVLPVYYLIMEFAFGKTLGKIFTKTHVISIDGNRLTFMQCLLRSILRFLIPFEFVSGILFRGIFWHDSIPKTMVIED